MDGPALVHTAWLLCLVWIWAYRRFFETVAERSPEFDAFCKSGPLVAAIATSRGAETGLAARLKEAMGSRPQVTATLGVWPWPYHALELRISSEPGLVLVHIIDCRVLRSRERPLPTLTKTLLAATESNRDAVTDTWLHAEAYTDGTGRVSPRGWRIEHHEDVKHPCKPRETAAAWCLPQGLCRGVGGGAASAGGSSAGADGGATGAGVTAAGATGTGAGGGHGPGTGHGGHGGGLCGSTTLLNA